MISSVLLRDSPWFHYSTMISPGLLRDSPWFQYSTKISSGLLRVHSGDHYFPGSWKNDNSGDRYFDISLAVKKNHQAPPRKRESSHDPLLLVPAQNCGRSATSVSGVPGQGEPPDGAVSKWLILSRAARRRNAARFDPLGTALVVNEAYTSNTCSRGHSK